MSEKVIRFLESKNIAISTTAGETRHNQVSESINHRVKTLVALPLISKETKALKKWRKIMPSKFKGMSLKQRAQNRDFRKLLFESELFNNKRYESIINAIHTYNKKDFSKDITLGQAEYFNTKLVSKNSDNVQILGSQSMLAKKVQKENKTSIESVKTVIENILGLDLTPDEKLMKIALLTLEGQSHIEDLLKRGFGGLAVQNAQLLDQNEGLQNELTNVRQDLKNLLDKFEEIQKEKALFEEARLKRKNRKKLPKRDPITKEIFAVLMEEFETTNYPNRYIRSRIKVALTLLLITGVRISELLPVKVGQVQSLFTKDWIAIDRSKRGRSNQKAFVSKEGRITLKNIRKDFEILLAEKTSESFIFTPQHSNKPIKREAFNREINGFIKRASRKLDNEPLLTSHSFRIGYITQLWRDHEDIEFVRQVIGHAKIDTTSHYVEELSDEEKQERINKIKIKFEVPEDLIIDPEIKES